MEEYGKQYGKQTYHVAMVKKKSATDMVKICATDISCFNKHICFQIWLKIYVQQMGNEPTHCFLYISPTETNSAKRCEMCEKKICKRGAQSPPRNLLSSAPVAERLSRVKNNRGYQQCGAPKIAKLVYNPI